MEASLFDRFTIEVQQNAELDSWVCVFHYRPNRSRPVHLYPQKQFLNLYYGSRNTIPSVASEKSCTVIFDGGLYNRGSLMQESRERFSTNPSDARVILEAYSREGAGILQRIEGVYSLIIHDLLEDKLLFARDRYGIYPLFYTDTGDELVLSQSINALIQQPAVSKEINRAAVAEQLCHRWLKSQETCFSKIKRVVQGHAVEFDGTVMRHAPYWNPLPENDEVTWINPDELEQFDGLLEQAVARAVEQGPSAILLSGGLDSVSVAAVATELAHKRNAAPPLALSLGFPNPSDNEESIQKGVASALGIEQIFLRMDEAVPPEGLLAANLELSAKCSSPLLSPWAPAYNRLRMEAKRRGCKVVLTGGGGDEWLSAHPAFAADCLWRLQIKHFFNLWNTFQLSYALPPLKVLHLLMWRYGARLILDAASRQYCRGLIPSWLRRIRQERYLSETIHDWVAPDPGLKKQMRQRLVESAQSKRELGKLYFYEARASLQHPVVSVEMEESFEQAARCGLRQLQPYWDPPLTQLLFRVPPHLLHRGGRSKGLVRESLAKRLPQLGFDKQKKTFPGSFFNSLLMEQGRAALKRINGFKTLAELGMVQERILNSEIEKLFSNGSRRHPQLPYFVWNALNLEAWLRPRV